MNKYNCDKCGFHTNNKTKYQRHLGTKKHQKSPQSHHKVTTKSPFLMKKRQKINMLVNIVKKHSNINKECIGI